MYGSLIRFLAAHTLTGLSFKGILTHDVMVVVFQLLPRLDGKLIESALQLVLWRVKAEQFPDALTYLRPSLPVILKQK